MSIDNKASISKRIRSNLSTDDRWQMTFFKNKKMSSLKALFFFWSDSEHRQFSTFLFRYRISSISKLYCTIEGHLWSLTSLQVQQSTVQCTSKNLGVTKTFEYSKYWYFSQVSLWIKQEFTELTRTITNIFCEQS